MKLAIWRYLGQLIMNFKTCAKLLKNYYLGVFLVVVYEFKDSFKNFFKFKIADRSLNQEQNQLTLKPVK